jgi:hypothetical protein
VFPALFATADFRRGLSGRRIDGVDAEAARPGIDRHEVDPLAVRRPSWLMLPLAFEGEPD